MLQTLEGLRGDLEVLCAPDTLEECERRGVTLADVLGTMGVNAQVLQGIHTRLRFTESEPHRVTKPRG